MPNAEQRKKYGFIHWCNYMTCSTEKNLEYNNDYYKYLRGMLVIRDLENYEQAFMKAYDFVVMRVKQ